MIRRRRSLNNIVERDYREGDIVEGWPFTTTTLRGGRARSGFKMLGVQHQNGDVIFYGYALVNVEAK